MGEELLTFYLQEWERFSFSSSVMNSVCSYLNRHCRLRDENVYEVHDMALDIWKETILEAYKTSISGTCLQLIKSERNGDVVNTGALKGWVDSLAALRTKELLDVYQQAFEEDFIRETEEFYVQEVAGLFQSGITASDYLIKVEQRLTEETRRVNLYLHMSSMDKLTKCCESVLVQRQLAFFYDEFPKLLKADKTADISRLFEMISKLDSDSAFGDMYDTFQTHVSSEGLAAIAQNKDLCNTDPMEYMKTLVSVYQKFRNLIDTGFKKNSSFDKALSKACEEFINKNDLTRDPGLSNKPPIMLARYCNLLLLKKCGKNYDEEELEDLLNKAIIILNFIEEKDVFQKFYSCRLATRLVGNLSASDDAELSMITKLNLACGFDYTTKLLRMYQDITLSKTMNEDFKKWLGGQVGAAQLNVDFYMMTLTSGSWPYSQSGNEQRFLLPQELTPCVNTFTQYYAVIHTGRKMNWLYSQSNGEVVTNCFPLKYTFVLPTFNIGVILQYNTKDSYKLRELADATKLGEDVITRIVQNFMRAGILKSNDDEDNLSSNSEIFLVKDYKNKKLKVNLFAPLKIDPKTEEAKAKAAIEEGRHLELQAAIVRIMKTRKQLNLQLLISEVIQQVADRFTPGVPLIKKCIEKLVEREYLQKKIGEDNVYEYVV